MTDVTEAIEATLVTGGVGTGKTQLLLERAAGLLADGTRPEDILVLCATPEAAHAFARRLATLAGASAAEAVNVTTPRAAALDVLSDEAAVRFTGRDPRLLNAFEESFLMEDMKVSGLRPRRLREMLKFFYRSWTELADNDPSWLLAGEEENVHALLKANLAFMRAMVEPEVANLAVRYLQAMDETRASHAYAHVLMDDYQCASRASQALAGLLASCTLTVAGDANACVEVYDSYPYAAGLDEFLATHPTATHTTLTVCHRSQASAQAAHNLLADKALDDAELDADPAAAPGDLSVLASPSPFEEFSLIARTVADAIQGGTPTSHIAVAAPNGVWMRNVVAALRGAGVPAETLPDSQPVRGDIRDNARCVPARILCALDLVANPANATAWRCWCGFGDYLANSAAIADLRSFADEQSIGLVEALEAMASEVEMADGLNGGSPANMNGSQSCEPQDHLTAEDEQQGRKASRQRVATAYQEGCRIIERAQKLAGRALLDELARLTTDGSADAAPAVVTDLCLAENRKEGNADDAAKAPYLVKCETEGGADDATAMAARASRRLLAPTLPDGEAVAVVPYDLMCGLSPDLLVVAGFANGFIPCQDYFDATVTPLDKQEKMHATDVRRVYSLMGKAEKSLIVSYFTATDLESASKLKLEIERIRLDHGTRMCTIAPSDFLAQMAPKE